MKTLFQARHGDLFIQEVPSIPKNTVKVPGRVLAHGTATGHSHVVDQGTLRRSGEGKLYLSAPKGAALTHEEHARIDLPPGKFEIKRQTEYVPGDLPRTVED